MSTCRAVERERECWLSVVDKTAATTAKDRCNMPRVMDGWTEFDVERQSYWTSRVMEAPCSGVDVTAQYV